MTDQKVNDESREMNGEVPVSLQRVDIESKDEARSEEDAARESNGELQIKDYLDESLFADIKEVTSEELKAADAPQRVIPDEVLALYNDTISDIAEHEIIKGRVIGQNEKEIIMDIGFKSEGIIPRSEFADKETPAIGEVLDIYLERIEDSHGQTILSKEKAEWMQKWNRIVETHNRGETVTGRIVRRIKGGMVVDIDDIQAFLPGSQIDVRPVQDFDRYLGREMEFKVVKVNRLRKNIVLSRKVLLEDTLKEQRDSLLREVKVGRVLEGRIKNITDFGVFIDLGGIDGLLHITDLSWGRVNHPSEMVELGQTLAVKVIDVDLEKQRISLGLKQLTPHPWESVPNKYPVGTKVKGKVVSMTNYGAFVEIEKGVEGLVHVSEMSWTRNVRHPSEIVQLGDEVEGQVLSVNAEERKIALGFKQLQPDPWEGVEERYPVGSLHKGTVRNLTQFGAFVQLEEGIDGLVHVSDLSWTKVIRHPKEILQKGQEVEVKVLEVSPSSRRIALGLKQTVEDPWSQIITYFEIGKTVSGEVIRVLEKGIILELEMDVEGIIPSRSFPHKDRKKTLARFRTGMTIRSEVVEVRPEDKKVILRTSEIPSKRAGEKEGAGSRTGRADSEAREVSGEKARKQSRDSAGMSGEEKSGSSESASRAN